MKHLISIFCLLSIWLTAQAQTLVSNVSGYAIDTNYAASSRSMGKSWVKKQAEENLKAHANSFCKNLNSTTEEIFDIDLIRSENGHTYEYIATGKVSCKLSAVGSCAVGFLNRPAAQAVNTVGVEEIKTCEIAHSKKIDVIFKVLLQTTPDDSRELLESVIMSIEKLGLSETQRMVVEILRNKGVAEKYLMELQLK